MEQQIEALIASLTEFKAFTKDLSNIKREQGEAKAELDKTKAALETTKSELSSATSGLTVAQVANVKQYEESIFTKRKELEALEAKAVTDKAELDELKAQINSARLAHKQIEDSIESLKKRFA